MAITETKIKTPPSKPAVAPVAAAGPSVTKVVMVEGVKMRHPVTGQAFLPGRPVTIVDLEGPENVFVRHQLEAGVFKIYQGD